VTLTIRNIIPILNAQFHGDREDAIIDTVSIDSRSLQNSTHTLFFALVGPNHNGHDYLKALLEQGVYNFVVEYIPDGMSGSANFLVVENSLNALHDFAAMYRSNFTFPIIGITGSNGKTIVKE
jgi:alanine racemase